jgi:Spy/CpxP family protein refolding chaperone
MRFLALFALLFTLLAADHDDHHERHLPMDISYLGLTHDQHDAVERIVRSHQQDHRHFKRRKRETRETISRLFAADRFDSGRFMELTSELHREADALQSHFLEAIHGVLTPEQRRRFAYYMEEWEIE